MIEPEAKPSIKPKQGRRKALVAHEHTRRANESVKDLEHAIEELQRAKDELVAIGSVSETSPLRIAAMKQEPLSRLELVRRYLVGVLKRNHWSPATELGIPEEG